MNTEKPNATKSVVTLLAMACVLTGLLAGENMYRYFMEVPAWRHLDIANWGEYVRYADLGAGIFIFPLEAFLGTILLLWIAILIRKNKAELKHTRIPVYLGTVFSFVGLALSAFAAPYLLGIRHMENDPVALKYAFDQFHFWGAWRALMQIMAFIFCIWGMARLVRE